MKFRYVQGKKIAIHEHLEFVIKNTTYADRWQWLKEANTFVRKVEDARRKKKLFKHKI